MVFRSLVLSCVLLAACAVSADAQIYTWRDEAGRLVLTNRPPDGRGTDMRSYPVPRADDVRTTQPTSSARAAAFDNLIDEHARRHGVRQSLVRAVIQVESAFNPLAVSSKGAMGLMQLMPATAREFGVTNAFSPSDNVRAGVAYLRRLLDRYDNDETLALAAYNAGPGAVDRYGQHVPPFGETQDYVRKINGLAGQRASTPATRIYRSVEIVDGREVVKYSDRPSR